MPKLVVLRSLLVSGPTTVVGKIGSSLLEGNSYGGRMGLVARPTTGEQHVRDLVNCCLMLTDTNFFVCAGRDYNKALPSGLIAEEQT